MPFYSCLAKHITVVAQLRHILCVPSNRNHSEEKIWYTPIVGQLQGNQSDTVCLSLYMMGIWVIIVWFMNSPHRPNTCAVKRNIYPTSSPRRTDRPPINPTGRPVLAQKILQASREAENALADALVKHLYGRLFWYGKLSCVFFYSLPKNSICLAIWRVWCSTERYATSRMKVRHRQCAQSAVLTPIIDGMM